MTASTATLRRRADALGYRIDRWPSRIGTPENAGGYMITRVSDGVPVAGFNYDYAIEAVADWLDQEERDARGPASAATDPGHVSTNHHSEARIR